MPKVRKQYNIKELTELLRNVAFQLRQFRENEGLSQNELARRAKVSKTTVNDLENGVATDIQFSTLCQLARVLKKHPGELIVGSDLELSDNERKEYLRAYENFQQVGSVFDKVYRRLK